MGRWTSWQKLAVGKESWSWDDLEGRLACYELGLGGPRRCSSPRVVYVGETGNLRQRLSVHVSHAADNLRHALDWHLRQGWGIYFRVCFVRSRSAGKRMQNSLLEKYDYDWNIQRNTEP